MTAFSSVNTTAQSLASSAAAAVTSAQTLRTSLSAAGIASLTLNNLATNPTNWRNMIADLRVQLDAAIADLATANSEISAIAAKVGTIAGLD